MNRVELGSMTITARVSEAWGRERARLLARAKRTVGSIADAEDVVQEAAITAIARAGGLRDEGRLSAWVGRIADRKAVDATRARAREERGRVDVGTDRLATPAVLPASCYCVSVRARTLRPAYAEVLQRIDERGERLPDVAIELGLTTNALTVRLFRARCQLRDTMKRHCGTTSARSCADCGCAERACCLPIDG